MNLDRLKSLTILYVEDEALIRQNAVEYLSRYCHIVLEASNGEEGYALYKQHSPDLIISDIKIPKLSGLEFASNIRLEDKKTPIIITTAHTDTEYLLKAVEVASKIFCKFFLSLLRLYQIIPRNILSIQPLGIGVYC